MNWADVLEFLKQEYQWMVGTMLTIITVVIAYRTLKHSKDSKKKSDPEEIPEKPFYIDNLFRQDFIGREKELEQLSHLLLTESLITLEGPGGCGKSSLAVEVARVNKNKFPHGACFVELAPLQKDASVLRQMARTFELKEQADKPPTQILSEFLSDLDIIIVLDNCEHVLNACVPLIEEIGKKCPYVRIIATSRIKLGLPYEKAIKVAPLALPADTASLEALGKVESVDLFMQQAQKTNPAFKLSEATKNYVVTICEKFNGIPLAIKLAAAQLDLHSVEEIAKSIDTFIDKLVRLPSDAGNKFEHHTTMSAAIDWSYQLLGENEKRVFRSLSIFSDDFTLEAYLNVAAMQSVNPSDSKPDKTLEQILKLLIDHNLVTPSTHTSVEKYSERRFFLLETMRQFGEEKLRAKEEIDYVANKFYTYFLSLAEEARSHFLGADQVAWLNLVEEQYANFRSAILWAAQLQNWDDALKLGAALWRFWEIRGYFEEGRERLTYLIDHSTSTNDDYYEAMSGLGMILYRKGDLAEAEKYFNIYLKEKAASDDHYGVAMATNDLGNVLSKSYKHQEALESFRKAKAMFKTLEDQRMIAVTSNNMANQHYHLKVLDQAQLAFESSIALFESSKNYWESGYPILGLANTLYYQDEVKKAEALYAKAYEIRKKAKDTRNMGLCKNGLARVAIKKSDRANASRHLKKSIHLLREVDDRLSINEVLCTTILFAHLVKQKELAIQLASFVFHSKNQKKVIPMYEEEPRKVIQTLQGNLPEELYDSYWHSGSQMSYPEIYGKIDTMIEALG